MDGVKVGDYVVYNKEKIKKRLDLIINKLTGTYIYDTQMRKLETMKNEVFIFMGWFGEGKFIGQVNGLTYSGLLTKEFRIATLKEKIKYDLSQIYNE